MADFYELLGVERSASQTDIKSAYRRLARKYHPDVNPDPAAASLFADITDAYQILGDPRRRRLYDTEGVSFDRTEEIRAQQAARVARRAYYQAQADKAVNEWLAKERLESRIRGHAVFTTVTLFSSTFVVAMFKPGIVEMTSPFWYTVVILLFAASIFHLVLILKRHFDHYTYQQDLVPFRLGGKRPRPITRRFAVGFVLGGYLFSLGLGFLISLLGKDLFKDLLMNTTFLDGIFSVLFYPPIAVLIVDALYLLSLRLDEI